jgi:hypothetical protein
MGNLIITNIKALSFFPHGFFAKFIHITTNYRDINIANL